jgi:hypothetical protein
VLGSPAKADGLQVTTGIPVTGPDVRQLAAADARGSVIPHMSDRADGANAFWDRISPSTPGRLLLVRKDPGGAAATSACTP